MNKYPLIIDVDTGCDDAIEIVMATLNDVNLNAITCTAGNTSLENVICNTTNILGFIESDTKAYAGCIKPIEREFYTDNFHGENGLGNIELPKKEINTTIDAIDYMYQTAMKMGKIQLLTSGPMTNVATLIQKYPDVVEHIDSITFMGGSLQKGNVTEYAEFNVYADPESYVVVFKTGIPMTMIGLDVTMVPSFDEEKMEELKKIDSKHSKLCQIICEYLLKMRKFEPDHQTHLHDVIALYSLIEPEAFEFKNYCLEIQCDERYRGQTRVINKENNCRVATQLDENKFWNWFMNSLKGE